MTQIDYSPLALLGVSDIAAGFPPGGFQYTPQVQAAIAAGLAYDSDPTYWASDMNIGRSAALTDLGLDVAHALGYLLACACPGCNREANPSASSAYCRMCQVRGNREGWVNGEQCYYHYLPTHPTVAAERSRLLDDNASRTRRDYADYARRNRYQAALTYLGEGDTLVKDFR